MHPYRNFILMITVSATLMFGLMYLNTYQPGHVWFSQTRLFMTFIMAGSMALVMLFSCAICTKTSMPMQPLLSVVLH